MGGSSSATSVQPVKRKRNASAKPLPPRRVNGSTGWDGLPPNASHRTSNGVAGTPSSWSGRVEPLTDLPREAALRVALEVHAERGARLAGAPSSSRIWAARNEARLALGAIGEGGGDGAVGVDGARASFSARSESARSSSAAARCARGGRAASTLRSSVRDPTPSPSASEARARAMSGVHVVMVMRLGDGLGRGLGLGRRRDLGERRRRDLGSRGGGGSAGACHEPPARHHGDLAPVEREDAHLAAQRAHAMRRDGEARAQHLDGEKRSVWTRKCVPGRGSTSTSTSPATSSMVRCSPRNITAVPAP